MKITPQTCRIISNTRLDKGGLYWSLKFADFKAAKKIIPGQFVHIKVAGGTDPYFRRAFSIADYDPKSRVLEVIYKVIGRGTTCLRARAKDEMVDLIGPLGNRFSAIPKNKNAVIVAGGVGFPPLYFLARFLIEAGHDPKKIYFFYGGKTRDDLIEVARIKKLGTRAVFCTDDGSFGVPGFVTKAVTESLCEMNSKQTYIYGCGPEAMLAALQELAIREKFSGELSLEAPMPCGVGVCLGCIKPTLADPKKYVRVCHDGPVFGIGEVML